MDMHEQREHNYSGSNDPLNDLVLTWILAVIALAAISVALPQ